MIIFFAILIIFILIVSTSFVLIIQKHEIQKKHLPFELLRKSQSRIKEYIGKYSPIQRLENYDVLKKSLKRIYDVIHNEHIQYDNITVLSSDYMCADVGIIPYENDQGNIEYISPQNALKFIQLMSDTERDSIDKTLRQTAEKWLNEISVIESILREK